MLLQFSGAGRFGDVVNAFAYLGQLGVLDAVIPFALIFSVAYAVVDQTKVITGKSVIAIVALSIALTAVIPHVLGLYPLTADPVSIINQSLPQIALIFVMLVLALLVIGLLGGSAKFPAGVQKFSALIAIAIVFLVMVGAFRGPDRLPGFLAVLFDPVTVTIVLVIALFAVIVYVVMSGSGTMPPAPPSS